MKPTKGPYVVGRNIGRKGEIGIMADAAPCIIATMGNQKEWPLEAEANATFAVAACNACIEINPDNPIAVAEAMPELVEALKDLAAQCQKWAPTLDRNRIRSVLSKIEAK